MQFLLSQLPYALLAIVCTLATAAEAPDRFDILELPVGQNVTLLKPATTLVPLTTRAILGATDLPQILKFEVTGPVTNSQHPSPLRMAIYDSNSDRVRYVDINYGVPFLYNFKSLDAIVIIPQGPAKPNTSQNKSQTVILQIESDKPLSIGR